MRLPGLAASLICLSLVAIACQVDGRPPAAPTPGASLQPPPTVTAVPADESDRDRTSDSDRRLGGEELYASVGCAACHGENAEGTDFAPGLAGHSVAQVKRQARAPIGIMPVFPPDKLSNEELQALAEYIAGLGGGHAHVRSGVSGDELIMHHWMAIIALESGETQEASHHVDHILQVAEGQHLRMMEKSRNLLSEGETHEAAHIIEQMLAGLDEAELDEPTMHVRLALSSLRGEDLPGTTHHVEHFMESVAEHRYETAERILEDISRGDLKEADEKLVLLLGDDVSEGEHDDADHDEGEEPHDDGHDDADGHDEAEGMPAEEEHAADGHDEAEGMPDEEEHPDDGHSH